MKKSMTLCLAALMGLSGCAAHTAGPDASLPAQASARPDGAFAASVAAQPEGAALPMSYTPLGGEILVTVGGVYESGMGKTCRQAVALFLLGERTVFAVCRGDDGNWSYIPPIFERTPG